MSKAITATNLIMVIVLCFLIGYGIKEMFFATEIEREDYSLSFKSEYLDSLDSKVHVEIIVDENGNEILQYLETYDGESKVMDTMPREEFEKEVKPYRESFARLRQDLSAEELEEFLAIDLFQERAEERGLEKE